METFNTIKVFEEKGYYLPIFNELIKLENIDIKEVLPEGYIEIKISSWNIPWLFNRNETKTTFEKIKDIFINNSIFILESSHSNYYVYNFQFQKAEIIDDRFIMEVIPTLHDKQDQFKEFYNRIALRKVIDEFKDKIKEIEKNVENLTYKNDF